MGAADRLLDGARRLALRPGEVEGLVHGLVPGLLLVVDVNRRIAGSGVGVIARGRASMTSPVPEGSMLGAPVISPSQGASSPG